MSNFSPTAISADYAMTRTFRLVGAAKDPGKADRELVRVLESHRRDLTRFAIWLARDRTVAEDIVQETMLRAWRARSGLRDLSAVRAWLFSIARREHARLYERKQLPLVDIHECMAREDERLALYDQEPQISELRRAILTLSDEYRIPLVMQVLGGFTAAEIASELGITVGNVLTRLFRARNKLREIYRASSLDGGAEHG